MCSCSWALLARRCGKCDNTSASAPALLILLTPIHKRRVHSRPSSFLTCHFLPQQWEARLSLHPVTFTICCWGLTLQVTEKKVLGKRHHSWMDQVPFRHQWGQSHDFSTKSCMMKETERQSGGNQGCLRQNQTVMSYLFLKLDYKFSSLFYV